MAEKLPVVYVRGFAGTTSGINTAVDDPFYGFNSGSTHVRVGRGGTPVMYQFEGPLLALLVDEGYELLGTGTQGGQRAWLEQAAGPVPANSVWVHRFYDVSATAWGQDPHQFSVEHAGKDLLELIRLVRAKTGAPRVYLVAHSMGGLICRCLLQKVIPDTQAAGDLGEPATDLVDRLFTFATPHGGIAFDIGFGLLEWARDTFGIAGADIFGPTQMWRYLTPEADQRTHEQATRARPGEGEPPPGWNPRSVYGAFPVERIFTLVGTNPGDYKVALGLSSAAVGVESDGLVQTGNAVVPGARQAYVHRSHSGRYGIVNSEEGYQNLRRFLLGDLEVHAALVGFDPPDPGADVCWQGEVELAVRGLPVLMHDRTAPHHCPLTLTPGAGPVDLGSTALLTDPNMRPDGHADRVRYTLRLSVLTVRQVNGFFSFNDHIEKTSEFDDHLVIDLDLDTTPGRPQAWAAWNSAIDQPLRSYRNPAPPLPDSNDTPGLWVSTIDLPDPGRAVLGHHAAIQLTVHPRTTPATDPGGP